MKSPFFTVLAVVMFVVLVATLFYIAAQVVNAPIAAVPPATEPAAPVIATAHLSTDPPATEPPVTLAPTHLQISMRAKVSSGDPIGETINGVFRVPLSGATSTYHNSITVPVRDVEAEKHENRRRALWVALQIRVLTDDEWREVLQYGDSINIEDNTPFMESEKSRERMDAYVTQERLRLLHAKPTLCCGTCVQVPYDPTKEQETK